MSFEDCLDKAGLVRGELVDWREAKFMGSGDESSFSGYLFLTKYDLVFVRDKGFLSSVKVMFKIPVKKITKIQKLLGLVIIMGNTADSDAGFFKKLFSSKGAQFKFSDSDSFIRKIKSNQ